MIRFALLCSCAALAACSAVPPSAPVALGAVVTQPVLSTRTVPIINLGKARFRDLNRNETLDPYEDWRLPAERRAADLVGRMTLVEKAGQMVVSNAFGNAPFGQKSTGYNRDLVQGLAMGAQVSYFNSMLVLNSGELAAEHNALQEMAEHRRLGIPLVISTDPRHHFQQTFGASVGAGDFSQWPEQTGLAALRDPERVKEFASIERKDLRAVGFQMLLGPQIDLMSEPRWARNNGTFGEDTELAAAMAAAYVEGIQGGVDGVASGGLGAVVKHFAGYSAAKDGFDAHNRYGRFAVMDEGSMALHLRPFEAAFAKSPSGVMPSYAILQDLVLNGKSVEQTGAAYSKTMMTDLLRGQYGFDGVVLTDWAVTADCGDICMNGFPAGQHPTFEGISTAWGVEHLSQPERFALALSVGVDQFGGVMSPSPIVEAVQSGLIEEAVVDRAVTRILTQSFRFGVFEAPFVDADAADGITGSDADKAAAHLAQAESMVVLQNRDMPNDLAGKRVFLRNVNADAARAVGLIVAETPASADFAIIRTAAPFEVLHPHYFFGSIQHEGSLAFPDAHPDLAAMRALPADLPVVVDVYLDRPAIVAPFMARASLLLGSFGASDAALFDVLMGEIDPIGRLPFELPSSMDAVIAQNSARPADSARPLFPLGHGETR